MDIIDLKKKPQLVILIYSIDKNKICSPTVFPAILNSTVELYRFRLEWLNKRTHDSGFSSEVSGLLGALQVNLDPIESDHVFNEILGLDNFMSPAKCLEATKNLITSCGFKITREIKFS